MAGEQGLRACLYAIAASATDHDWHQLVEQCAEDMHRVAGAVLYDDHLVDDAVQEAFLQIRDCAASCKAGSDAGARAWVMRIAYTSAIRLGRRHVARQHRDRKAADGMACTPQNAPDERVLQEEDRHLLKNMLGQLRSSHREAVVLHVMSGLGYDAVGEALGCAPGAARVRVHRGLKQLRRRMQRIGVLLSLPVLCNELAACTISTREGVEQLRSLWQSLLHSPHRSAFPSPAALMVTRKVSMVVAAMLVPVCCGVIFYALPPAVVGGPGATNEAHNEAGAESSAVSGGSIEGLWRLEETIFPDRSRPAWSTLYWSIDAHQRVEVHFGKGLPEILRKQIADMTVTTDRDLLILKDKTGHGFLLKRRGDELMAWSGRDREPLKAIPAEITDDITCLRFTFVRPLEGSAEHTADITYGMLEGVYLAEDRRRVFIQAMRGSISMDFKGQRLGAFVDFLVNNLSLRIDVDESVDLENLPAIDYRVHDVPVVRVMDDLTSRFGLRYEVAENRIVILPGDGNGDIPKADF